MQETRHASTSHQALTRENLARAKEDKAKTNQRSENWTNRNAGSEKSPTAREHQPERTRDVTQERNDQFRNRDYMSTLITDVIPQIDRPIFDVGVPINQFGGGDRTFVRRGRTVYSGGNTPATFVEVGNPCVDKVLMVTTAKNACINGKVHIEGKEYWYCRTTKEIETKPYSYLAIPEQNCDNNNVIQMEYLPQGWKKAAVGEGGCTDTGRKIIQYSPEGLYWMKITWDVWKCRDANGNEVERLGTATIRENTGILVTEDPPVKPTDYTPPTTM